MYLLDTSSPLALGHGCLTIVFAGVGGQHKNVSHVELQYEPEMNINQIISLKGIVIFLQLNSMDLYSVQT